VQSGRLHALGVMSPKRSPTLSQVPTMAEAGVADLNLSAWMGFLAPAKTPRPVIMRLNTEVAKILNMPDVKEFLFKQGLDAAPGTPEQFAAYMKSEREKWGKVIKAAGLKAEG